MNETDYLDEEYLEPKPRKPEPRVESKANSKRAELLQRILIFLNYKNPKVFAIRVAHLKIEDLEYMLSSAKQFKPNPRARFWSMLNKSTPK